jgi:predicted transcriptional regulator
MRRTPCEYMLWLGIPTIRRELAETLIKQFGLSQRETAEKLGITPSAVCQYLSKKRGKNDIFDDSIVEELAISAERIIKNDEEAVVLETCRICQLIQKSKEFQALYEELQSEAEE